MLLAPSGRPLMFSTSHASPNELQAPWRCSPYANLVLACGGHDTRVPFLRYIDAAVVRLTCATRGAVRSSALPARHSSSRSPSSGSDTSGLQRTTTERRLALTLGAAVAVGAIVGTSAASARNTYPLDYVCKTAPCHSEEDPVAARIRKEIAFKEPMRSLGQTWDIRQLDQTKRGLQIFYPPWLAGRWAVRSKYLGAELPQGRNLSVPQCQVREKAASS
eukprot:TRINITY_DN21702_c0_g1_i1.p1 TRINITY_DN21702_c0_g1~~TRINITY_DN21702_c0_g1_i1.p1  ORF type:complete len:219 (+),score=8.28 TRINITY_DN21702_c0_g1_i1:107-763(+)